MAHQRSRLHTQREAAHDVEPPWSAYLATVVTVRGTDVADWHGPRPLWVITAANPLSRPRTDSENAARHDQLVAHLETTGLEWWEAEGRSPDGTHAERSVAVAGIDRAAARELGQAFGQAAVFEITDDELRVVSCIDDRTLSRPL